MDALTLPDWLQKRINDILSVGGVMPLMPFQPEITIGVGKSLGHVRLTAKVKIDRKEGEGVWEGPATSLAGSEVAEILRGIMEDAIRQSFQPATKESGVVLTQFFTGSDDDEVANWKSYVTDWKPKLADAFTVSLKKAMLAV